MQKGSSFVYAAEAEKENLDQNELKTVTLNLIGTHH